jgi:hypothetical protein
MEHFHVLRTSVTLRKRVLWVTVKHSTKTGQQEKNVVAGACGTNGQEAKTRDKALNWGVAERGDDGKLAPAVSHAAGVVK